MNLIKMSLVNKNMAALRILLNELYSYQLYPSDLEWSIQYSSVSLVSYIVSLSSVVIYPSTKSLSIELAFKNISQRDGMLKLILDNPQLYYSPTTSQEDITDNNESTKKFKSEDSTPILTKPSNKKFNIEALIQIGSSEVQNRLLDLNMFEIQIENLQTNNHSLLKLFDSINKIVNGNAIVDRAKEINKLLVMESRVNYDSYLSRYDELINGLDIMTLIYHCLRTFSFNALSHLLSSQKSMQYIQINKVNIEKKEESTQKHTPSIEFIKLYLSNLSKFNNNRINIIIDHYIFKCAIETCNIEKLVQIVKISKL